MNIEEIREKYPQYRDLSDEQLAQGLHRKYYADLSFEDFSAKIGLAEPKPAAPPKPTRTAGQQVARQGGLTARHAVEGVLAVPAMLANVPGMVGNALLPGQPFPEQNAAISNLLTRAGLPQPEGAGERLVGDASRAVAGAGGVAGAAKQFAGPLAQALSQRLGMQSVAAATSGTAAGGAREAGLPPWAQMVAGVAGGFLPYTAAEGSKALVRGGRALVEPFTQGGRERIVGGALNESASDAASARAKLASSTEIVPGSKPTTGTASGDYGLLATERAAKNAAPGRFAERASDQNLARQQFIEKGAKTPKALEAAETRREAVTKPLRDQALAAARGKPADNAALLQKIDTLIADPDNAGGSVQAALKKFRGELEGKTDAQALYAIRKEINRVLEGRFVDSDESVLRYAGGQLAKVKTYIDDAIGGVSGNVWKQYLAKYSQLSKPIDRMRQLQEAQASSGMAAPDTRTGVDFLSQAKWRNQVGGLLASGVLTKGQQTRVQAVADDLARGASINNTAIRAVGSNTAQDMTVANLLGQMLGSTKLAPLTRTIARPLQWVYKVPEAELQKLLTDAMLDPKLAAALMNKASPRSAAQLSAMLRERFVASATASAQPKQTEQESTQQ